MGDRGNIKLGREKSVWVYSHWGGSVLPMLLQKALKEGAPWWGDEAYLNRIIAQTVMESAGDRLTGVGITAYMTDNQHDILEVDHEECKVRVLSQRVSADWPRNVLGEWSFEEYCNLGGLTWGTLL